MSDNPAEEKPTVASVYAVLCRKARTLRHKLISTLDDDPDLKAIEEEYAATVTVRDDVERMLGD